MPRLLYLWNMLLGILILFCIISPSPARSAIEMCKVLQLNLTGTNRISDGWSTATSSHLVIEFFNAAREGSDLMGGWKCRWWRAYDLRCCS